MTSHDWLIWAAYAFFGLALCYLGESFLWHAPHLLQNLWLACLISSGIFAAAAFSIAPAQPRRAKVRSRH